MQTKTCVSTTICILLLFCLIQLQTTAPTFVSASLCQITDVAYDYPQQVQPNQQILLTSTISASCAYSDPGIYYLAMVVVNDATSSQEISINSTPIGYVSLQQPNVTVTISNLITCPSGNVAWQLRLTVYVINVYNQYFSPVQDTALIHYLTVNVGTPQQQQQTVATTRVSPTITSTTPQMTTNTTTLAPATSLETTNNQSSITSQSLTILGLAILIVLLILFWKQRTMRKQNTDSDKPDTVKQKKEKRNSDT